MRKLKAFLLSLLLTAGAASAAMKVHQGNGYVIFYDEDKTEALFCVPTKMNHA